MMQILCICQFGKNYEIKRTIVKICVVRHAADMTFSPGFRQQDAQLNSAEKWVSCADTPALQALTSGAPVGPAHIGEYCAWAFHRGLKLARTITDWAGAERIQAEHLAEAFHLRSAKTADVRRKLRVKCVITRSSGTGLVG